MADRDDLKMDRDDMIFRNSSPAPEKDYSAPFENTGVPTQINENINITPEQYTNNNKKDNAEATEALKSAGQNTVRMMEQSMNEQENDVEQGKKQVQKATDILSLAIGNATDANINATYNRIDFGSDEAKEWMSKIEYGENTDYNNVMNSGAVSFAEDESRYGSGTARVDVLLDDGSRATITQAQIDEEASKGYFTLAGRTEDVAHTEERAFQFTAGDTGATYSYTGKDGSVVNGSVNYELDKMGQKVAVIDGHSFSANQIEASTYNSNLASSWAEKAQTAAAAGNNDLAAKYSMASEAWAQKSVVTAQFTSHDSVDKQFTLAGSRVLDKNGVATGYDAKSLIGTDYKSLHDKSVHGESNSGAFIGAASTNPLTAHEGDAMANKATAVRNMADAGYKYLSEKNDLLRGKLTRTSDPAVRLKDLNKAESALKKELKLERNKAGGDPSKIKALEQTIKDIHTFKKFGGEVTDFNTSHGLSASQKRGVRTLVNMTGVTESDAVAPIMQVTNTYSTVKGLVNTAGNAGHQIRMAQIRNQNRMAAKADRLFNNDLTNKWAEKASKKEQKAYHAEARDRAKRRGGETWRNFKEEEKLSRLNKNIDKHKGASDKILAKQNELLNQNKILDKKIAEAKGAGKNEDKLKRQKERNKRENSRLERKNEQNKAKASRKQRDKDRIEGRRAWRAERRKATFSYKIKEKWNNSGVGKAVNKVSVAASAFAAKLKEALAEILDIKKYVIGGLAVFIGGTMILTTVLSVGLQYVGNFMGDVIAIGEDVEEAVFPDTSSINYNQYIVDKTGYSLGSSFAKVCASDAKWHFLIDGIFKKNPSGTTSDATDMYWYRSLDEAEIGHVWAREEADNTTTHQKTGELMWGDTYIADPDKRTELEGININLAPIISMANMRIDTNISYKNFRTVEAYCYYMFVVSHDKARYDDRNGDGKIEGDDEDPYELDLDVPYHVKDKLHGNAERTWNTKDMTMTELKENNCNNIYIHGYSGESFGILGGARMGAAKTVDSLALWIKGKDINNNMTPVGTELCCTNDLSVLSGNYKDASETVYSITHMKEDGTTYTTSHNSAFIGEDGKFLCGNFTAVQWSENEDAYLENQRNAFTGTLDPTVKGKLDKLDGNVWGATTCGKNYHDHSKGRLSSCNSENCPYKDHEHTDSCYDADGNLICEASKHTCGKDCCSLQHIHAPWNSYKDPGCWTTMIICQGHCGGHLKATMNVVVMNEWESLMASDNFKMCYFLREGCFTSFLDFDKYLLDIDVWQFYWNTKVYSWFNPISSGLTMLSSPFGFLDWTNEKFTKWRSSVGEKKNKDKDKGESNVPDTGGEDTLKVFESDAYKESGSPAWDKLSKLAADEDDAAVDARDAVKNLPEDDYERECIDEENDIYHFDGWWSEEQTKEVYKGLNTGYVYKITKTFPAGYEASISAMRGLYGDNDNNWESVRTAFHPHPIELSDGTGIDLEGKWGICFPSGNDSKNPGIYRIGKLKKK